TWTRLAPAGTLPAARWGHRAGYDPGTQRLIVFGGTSAGYALGSNVVSGDTWILSNADGTAGTPSWKRLSVAKPIAPARLGALFAYAPSQNRALLLGGANNRTETTPLGDSWVLHEAGGSLPVAARDLAAPSFTPTGL